VCIVGFLSSWYNTARRCIITGALCYTWVNSCLVRPFCCDLGVAPATIVHHRRSRPQSKRVARSGP
jgi:hypothetical protein